MAFGLADNNNQSILFGFLFKISIAFGFNDKLSQFNLSIFTQSLNFIILNQ